MTLKISMLEVYIRTEFKRVFFISYQEQEIDSVLFIFGNINNYDKALTDIKYFNCNCDFKICVAC